MGEGPMYFWKDFEWNDLRDEVENEPAVRYHLLPFDSSVSLCLPASPFIDSKAWDDFHIRHYSARFYKEKRYLPKEFPELLLSDKYYSLLEVGCGSGSAVLPILRRNKNIIVYACDCSHEAIRRANEKLNSDDFSAYKSRFHLFHCDVSESRLPSWLACTSCRDFSDISLAKNNGCCLGGVDFVSLIFVLSAVPVGRMLSAINECFSVLRPGGLLLFRDYGTA